MNFDTYQQTFRDILNNTAPPAPYDKPEYINYTRLNWTRQQRWLKHGVLNTNLATAINNIQEEQLWTIITEPWCGDAAHTIPFIHRLTAAQPLITTDYHLRDTPPFLIEHYLTNGTKSIPRLIIADRHNKDLAIWGPRPATCQLLYRKLTDAHAPNEEKKIALQQWYNEDKGVSFQAELLAIVQNMLSA
ncbi:thioredoxin family protein [Deminuibacter soli]|uniref:Thioredoxin family protein n=1 Tax=Deminuibacter soli TaxID=2291815 RepID=A0A3E1NEV0_9BACT|nr:thioredoxin family protein [Deminuibacter soli]RFM26392.1 thioredoxin family protein [Deminuibacter soli]